MYQDFYQEPCKQKRISFRTQGKRKESIKLWKPFKTAVDSTYLMQKKPWKLHEHTVHVIQIYWT